MNFLPRDISSFVLSILMSLVLISCDRHASNESSKGAEQVGDDLKIYGNQGFKVVHPAGWSLLHDEPGIIADRTIAFETPEASRVSVYIYESSPRTYSDLADDLAHQLNLESDDNIHDYQRKPIALGGFEGIRMSWKSVGLSVTLNEVTILELRESPFPVFLQFRFFDGEIESRKSDILTFMQGITL